MSNKRRMIIIFSTVTTLSVSTVALSQSLDEPICYFQDQSGEIRDLSHLCGVDSGQAGDSSQQPVHRQFPIEVEIVENGFDGESYVRFGADSLGGSDDPQLNALGNYVNELEKACAGSDKCYTDAGFASVTQEICDAPGACPHYLLVENYENLETGTSEE